jgi:hypothetical protein
MSKRKSRPYPNPNDWCPIIINDERSLEKLNGLMVEGWCLPGSSGRGGLVWIQTQTIFQIQSQSLDYLYEGLSSAFKAEEDHPLVLLLLRHGRGIEKQMALRLPVNADGYKDTEKLEEIVQKDARGWEVAHIISITRTFGIAILRSKNGGRTAR